MPKASVKKSGATKRAGAERAPPAQHRFLTELAKERRAVAIFLINGLKLEGRIVSFDDYAILLEGDLSDHVYKHAISTIQPLAAVSAKAPPRARAGGRAAAITAYAREPEYAAAPERKPKQPTIVVRPKRRVIKSTPGEG